MGHDTLILVLMREVLKQKKYTHISINPQWASYRVGEIAGCAFTGNAGDVFPVTDYKETVS